MVKHPILEGLRRLQMATMEVRHHHQTFTVMALRDLLRVNIRRITRTTAIMGNRKDITVVEVVDEAVGSLLETVISLAARLRCTIDSQDTPASSSLRF